MCCQTSWFCTQQLPHHLSLCILIISREHHSVATILLPAFSSLPRSLWQPRLFFFIASLLCAAPSSPVVIGLSCSPTALCSALLNTFTSLLTRVYFCFFPIYVLKVVIAFFCNLMPPPPTDLTEGLPAKWHWQIKNTSEYLSDLVLCMFMSLSVFIFWVPICHTEKLARPWFYCTSPEDLSQPLFGKLRCPARSCRGSKITSNSTGSSISQDLATSNIKKITHKNTISHASSPPHCHQTSHSVLGYLPGPVAGTQDFKRVLKNGGGIITAFIIYTHTPFTSHLNSVLQKTQ